MKISKVLSIVSAAAVALVGAIGGIEISVRAESRTYQFIELMAEKKVKVIGRSESDFLSAYWSGNGFEINVDTAGGEMKVGFATSENKMFFAISVDGTEYPRAFVTNTDTSFSFDVPAGQHTVKVIRDTQISKSGFTFINDVTFDGTVLDAPENKDMYIEVIGDSISCGDGSLGTYVAGQKWTTPDDDSATHSFGWYLAEMLDADVSIVGRGGIGFYSQSTGSQEAVDDVKFTIQEIYNYTNGYTSIGNKDLEYNFKRQPDLIILEIGANDDTKDETNWKSKLVNFVEQIREKNGEEVPIVWVGKNETHYSTVLAALQKELKGKNVYAFRYTYGGSGSAALATQTAGHPSAAEQKTFAENILRYLNNNSLNKPLEKTEKAEKTEKSGSAEAKKASSGKIDLKMLGILGGAVIAAAGVTVGTVLGIKKKKKKNGDE